MAKHRSLTNVENHGYVILKSLTDFPQENPDLGSICRINGVAYIYDSIQGFETWYPLTNRYSTYVHNQGAASDLWTVNYNLGTQNVLVQIYDGAGVLSIASPSEMTDNSFKVSFTAPITGVAIVTGKQIGRAHV